VPRDILIRVVVVKYIWMNSKKTAATVVASLIVK